MKVLFIGATGLVGKQIVPLLKPQYDLTLAALGGGEIDGQKIEDLDITCWEAIEALTARGTSGGEPFDAVVNCCTAAYRGVRQRDPDERLGYYERCIEVNMRGSYHIYEAAARAGVPRVVCISSLTAITGEPRYESVAADAPDRPNDLYAASKVFVEHVGRGYVFPHLGGPGKMSVICLRLGQPYPSFNPFDERVFRDARSRSMVSDVRDIARGVDAALRADVRYGVYPLISASDTPYLDVSKCAEIGYSPAWRFSAEGVVPVHEPADDAVRAA